MKVLQKSSLAIVVAFLSLSILGLYQNCSSSSGGGLSTSASNNSNSNSTSTSAYSSPSLISSVVPNPSPVASSSSVVITVTLNGAQTNTTTFEYQTVDGSATSGTHYTSSSGTISFAPGQTTATLKLYTLSTIPVNNSVFYVYFGQLDIAPQVYVAATVTITGSGSASGSAALTTGGFHSCGILSGAAYCVGQNKYGQLGNGAYSNSGNSTPQAVSNLTSGVTAIAAGQFHTCAIMNSTVYCWGLGSSGQLGQGQNNMNSYDVPQIVPAMSQATQIASGAFFSCALNNGGVYCWGDETYGELGSSAIRGTPTLMISSGATAISAGAFHVCAIVSDGVKCWGRNDSGQIGNGGQSTYVTTPTAVSGLSSGVTSVAAGPMLSCAVKSSTVYCWGDNSLGELGTSTGGAGYSSTPVVPVTTDVTPSMSASSIVSVAINGYTTGTAYLGTLSAVTDPNNIALAAGSSLYNGATTCAIDTSGALWCWGHNQFGQVGINDTAHRGLFEPHRVMASGVTAVSSGNGFEVCVTYTGSVYCWGLNNWGQVGNGAAYASTPVYYGPVSVTW